MSTSMRLDIRPVDDDSALAAARSLIRAHVEAHSTVHDAASTAALLAALPAPYVPPPGGLWVAWDGPDALGCVALQSLEAGVAELKRMYVRPESRGQGVARALSAHAIAEARARGYARLRLGTLSSMRPAQALYTGLGFRPIAPYRPIEFGDTLFYELELGDSASGAVIR